MPTFKELADVLDSTLKNVSEKKLALDAANKTAERASDAYQDSMNKAQSLRQQVTDALEKSLGASHDNVKIRTPLVG